MTVIAVAAVAALTLSGCRNLHPRAARGAAGATTVATTTSPPPAEPGRRPSTTATTSPPDPVAIVTAAAAAHVLPRVPLPGEPVPAPDAAGLAAQLDQSWSVVHDPTASDAAAAAAGHVEQVVTRRLAADPALRAQVLARLRAPARTAAAVDIDAAARLRSLVGAPRTALPPWRIVAPAPSATLLADYKAAAAATGVPWQDLAAIHLVETRFGRIRGASEAGARGPMQFLPATFAAYGAGGNIEDQRDSIFAAARMLRANGAAGGDAGVRRAVFQYNHDNRYVDAVLAYAGRMAADDRAFTGYYGWQVYYVTSAGDVWLPVGYQG